MLESVPDEVRQVAPGMFGSALALLFARRPLAVGAAMFVGGVVMSVYMSDVVTELLGAPKKYTGAIGFMIGSFGMALMAKAYDTITAIQPGEVWSDIRSAVRKRLGVE